MKVGIVVWVEGLSVKFRVLEGVRVERGQLVKIEDGGVKYIARVHGFKPESLLTPAEIARISHRRGMGEGLELLDAPLRYYDTALATLVAQVEGGGECHGPTGSPRLFSEVEELGEEDLAQLCLDVGDIDLGLVRVGHRAAERHVRIAGHKAFPHHVLISSITGGGKTNLGKVLAWNVMKAPQGRYSLVVIDTEGEYFDGGDAEHLGLAHSPSSASRLLFVTSRVSTVCRVDFRFKYDGHVLTRSIPAHPLEVSWTSLHPEDLCQTGEFSLPQESLLWLAFSAYGDKWLPKLMELDDDWLYENLKRRVQRVTIAVTKRKLRHMLGAGGIFKPTCFTDLIKALLNAVASGKTVLIDMPSATEEQEKLLSVVVARRIFSYYEAMKKSSPSEWAKLPTALILVEEAHRYLSKSALEADGVRRENVFSTISKRGRKYRVGLCCITQMPGELDEPIVRQQLTKIVLPLPTRPDYAKVIHYSPFLERSAQEIKSLDRGEALLISPPSGIKFAVPLKVHLFEDLVRAELEEELIKRREAKELLGEEASGLKRPPALLG
ncbi:MAG: ATP-binding protein [Candidatus Nezhaarchaeota archaeon]|nr:ATP-binding protein [Candidatus Nezhaarchaeota archaeon]